MNADHGSHRYVSAGLMIASDIACPSLEPAPAMLEAALPDMRVVSRAGDPPPCHGGREDGPNWTLHDDHLVLDAMGIARFRIHRDGLVEVWPQGHDATLIPPFVVGTCLGVLLHLRGAIVLHASAVEVGGAAVLFCGPSGAGKSTIAATLHRQGYDVLCDDLCALTVAGAGVSMVPDGRKLKLWDTAIEALDLAPQRGERVGGGFDKFLVSTARADGAPRPVRALYMLASAPEGRRPSTQPLPAAQAMLSLIDNAYRPLLARRLGAGPIFFQAGAALLRAGAIHRLDRPLDFAANGALVAALRAHWRRLGLA